MSTTASQQFDGPTLEQALAAAVDALGEDLEIVDAQRVRRRGPFGLRRRQRFEVTAQGRPVAEPRDFDDVLRRMVDRVDRAERAASLDDDGTPDWWRDAELVIPEPPPAGLDFEVDVRLEPARATSVPTAGDVATAAAGPAGGAPSATATTVLSPPTPIAIDSQPPAWSTSALLELGLPSALVDRVRPEDLEADLDWVAALATAVAELLETAESISGPCELTGHGAASAVHLIRGACDGFRLDSLIIDGRRVPATPLELSLAIRSLLRAEG